MYRSEYNYATNADAVDDSLKNKNTALILVFKMTRKFNEVLY